MKQTIEILKALAQAVTLLIGAGAILCFVFFPGFFAERLGLTLQALDREEVTAKIKLPLLEAELRRVKTELTDADTRAVAALDAIEAETTPPSPARPGEDLPAPVIEPTEPLRSGDWVVIAGAEQNLADQRIELQKLQAAGYGAVILQSDSWYQSAVPFDTKAEAEAHLAAITKIVGDLRQPYIRSLSVWCSQRTAVTSEPDLFRCG